MRHFVCLLSTAVVVLQLHFIVFGTGENHFAGEGMDLLHPLHAQN